MYLLWIRNNRLQNKYLESVEDAVKRVFDSEIKRINTKEAATYREQFLRRYADCFEIEELEMERTQLTVPWNMMNRTLNIWEREMIKSFPVTSDLRTVTTRISEMERTEFVEMDIQKLTQIWFDGQGYVAVADETGQYQMLPERAFIDKLDINTSYLLYPDVFEFHIRI